MEEARSAFKILTGTPTGKISLGRWEDNSLYRSPNGLRVIKSRRLRSTSHVARMEEGRSAFKIVTGKPTV